MYCAGLTEVSMSVKNGTLRILQWIYFISYNSSVQKARVCFNNLCPQNKSPPEPGKTVSQYTLTNAVMKLIHLFVFLQN